MIETLPSFSQLIKQLQQVPFLASRHVYRVAHHFLHMDEQKLKEFCTALVVAQQNLIKCPTCFIWMERASSCLFCSSHKRDKRIVCVVETWYDVWAIERTGSYQGVYHVLGGAICPLDGIGPEDLTIGSLIERVNGHNNLPITDQIADQSNSRIEIILALSQTPEGEATAAYIARKLESINIAITCLARGMPVGSALEMLDRLTIHKALNERRPF